MVIQRWQSVLLLIAAVMMGLFAFCSLGEIQISNSSLSINALGLQIEGLDATGQLSAYNARTLYLFVVALLCMIVPFIAIFCYKTMRLQKRLCWITIMLIAALCLSEYVFVSNSDAAQAGELSWSAAAIAPVIALVALIAAWRMIVSDGRKLAASDRIR